MSVLDGALVATGAAVGAPLRWWLGTRLDTARLHRGTLLANTLGSLLLGLFSGLALTGHPAVLLGTGLCGALTTYSSFVVQTHTRGLRAGAAYAALTLAAALLACTVGFALGAWLGGVAGVAGVAQL